MSDLISERLFMGEFLRDEEAVDLERIAKEYHVECDEYDQKVCSVEFNGLQFPANNQELSLMSSNARAVRRRLIDENPYPAQVIDKAIRYHCPL